MDSQTKQQPAKVLARGTCEMEMLGQNALIYFPSKSEAKVTILVPPQTQGQHELLQFELALSPYDPKEFQPPEAKDFGALEFWFGLTVSDENGEGVEVFEPPLEFTWHYRLEDAAAAYCRQHSADDQEFKTNYPACREYCASHEFDCAKFLVMYLFQHTDVKDFWMTLDNVCLCITSSERKLVATVPTLLIPNDPPVVQRHAGGGFKPKK